MAKFNVPLCNNQRDKRARISERKRDTVGDPITRKLKNKTPAISLSGKRKRKLEKKWRKEQKEALQKGLVTMEDIEMIVADAEDNSEDTSKAPMKFHLKKGAKLRIKNLNRKGKSRKKHSAPAAKAAPAADTMVE